MSSTPLKAIIRQTLCPVCRQEIQLEELIDNQVGIYTGGVMIHRRCRDTGEPEAQQKPPSPRP